MCLLKRGYVRYNIAFKGGTNICKYDLQSVSTNQYFSAYSPFHHIENLPVNALAEPTRAIVATVIRRVMVYIYSNIILIGIVL